MILAYADDAGMDVTVTSTHGRSGTDRYANGNVAGKVVGLADLPVPTVRAADA
jgi:nucleotide-binding universal stress UspA family protein